MYESEVIDYIPIKYAVNQTFNENTAFIPTKFDVNVRRDKANVSIEVLDFKHASAIDLLEYSVQSLRKEEHFSKNSQGCKHNAFRTQNHQCVNYYKIDRICLTFNYTDEEGWDIVGNCGIKWKTMLNDSREY